ncbi:MAG TPA: hydrogenase/urease maturation nickel metallochaperone HypA [Gemmatimonadales bacterium]
MHELSLALEVCRIAEAQLDGADARRLRRVGLEVGEDANIEVANFEFCLEALLGAPPFGAARPAITRCPGADLRLAFMEVDDDGPDD